MLRRSASSDSANHRTKHSHHRKDENRIPVHSKDYDEIDQIYDYVRGFAPLPKNIKSPFSDPSPSIRSHSSTPSQLVPDITKPEPPPIETIPTKKLQAEKRNRKSVSSKDNPPPKNPDHVQKTPPGLPKLYVKNGHSQRNRLLRQKSASPMKETPPSPMSKSGSPLFNIRYKSLNNLQQAMELDGTLDSSNSGGRASGDSGGQKQPEKRSRKLSRPRSLTNLVWEIREHPDISMPKKTDPVAIIYKKQSKHSVNGQRQHVTLYL